MYAGGKSLEVDFHGPIVFRLCKKEAWAYLPMCANHRCNILTDCNDISPTMHKIFELRGPTAASTKHGGELSIVERAWAWGNGPKPRKCYCIFKLPSPDVIFGLRAEYVKIEIPNETTLTGPYARGLRFRYNECNVAPTIYPPDGAASGDLHDFKAIRYGDDDLYQLEIRYHDTKFQPKVDHHHRDAMNCSRSMRKLFPPCDKWKVNFEPPKNDLNNPDVYTLGGKHPVDCGANLIVFADGITL